MTEVAADLAEVIELGAVDSILFEKYFFPETSRVAPASFHPEMNAILDGTDRFCNFEIFRGGAKTTKFRMFATKRIAYGVSRTIVIVGKNQDHALRTTTWIKRQVEKNKRLKEAFRLRKGAKWQDAEFQIINDAAETATWVVALGISGTVRGVNLDDYRPDLILVDDVLDEENASTPEQRLKTERLVLGALKHSLISPVEAPFAKMVILQTPIDAEDISQVAKKDPTFKSVRYGCWTAETEDLPVDQRESSWPALFPTELLRGERAAAAAQNKLSIFSREMECKLITPENSKFREEWLQFHGPGEEEKTPEWFEMWIEIVIDPVPPPSEAQLAKGLEGKDFEAITAVGKKGGKYYLLETSYNRGHEPSWTVSEFFRMCNKWRPKKVLVESVAYQRTLAWLLRQAMKTAGRYWMVEEFNDKRPKPVKIVDGITGVASNRQLYISRKDHTEFMSQYITYPNVRHDDVLETVAIALTSLQRGGVGDTLEDHEFKETEKSIEDLGDYRGAP
jgi:phage terminase large subunit-like protein